MVSELTDCPDIRLLRPFGEAAELEIRKQALLEWGHGAPSCP